MNRTLLARFALLIATFAFVFALAEVAVRLLRPVPKEICEEAQPGPEGPVLKSIYDFSRPNASGRMVCNVVYRTNGAGFRGPEMTEAKPPGVFRIAIAGDSYTMGSGVAEDDTYVAQLENLLNEDAPAGRRFETMNLGIAGLAIQPVVRRLEEIGMRFDPDLLIYGWTLNDIEGGNYARLVPWADRLADFADTQRLSAMPSKLVAWIWSQWSYLTHDESTSYQSELLHNYFENELAWADFTAGLDRLATLQEREGRCVVVFLNPHLVALDEDHAFKPVYQRVEAASRERGLFPIVAFPAFEGREPHPLWVALTNSHPNAEGHEILARALRDGLKRLPSRCWR